MYRVGRQQGTLNPSQGLIPLLTLLSLLLAGLSIDPSSLQAYRSIQDSEARLEIDNGRERQLAGGEQHIYKLNLKSGQSIQIVVEQLGIDLTLTLLGPDKSELTTVDSPNNLYGAEPLYWIAETDSDFLLIVRPIEKERVKGSYRIKIAQLRPAQAWDRALVAAQQALCAAQRLNEQGTSEALRQAIAKYQQAAESWRAAGNQIREAYTLDYLGRAYDDLGERAQALDSYQRALAVARQAADRQMEAITLHNIGFVYRALNNSQEALKYYRQALALERETGDRVMERSTLTNIAALYAQLNDRRQMLDTYQQMLALEKSADNRSGAAEAMIGIAELNAALGEPREAIKYFNEALQAFNALGEYKGAVAALNNLGLIYRALGDHERALTLHNEALELARKKSDLQLEAATLISVGALFDSTGEKQRALESYNQALPLAKLAKDRQLQATLLNNIGKLYKTLGERDRALSLYGDALAIARELSNRRLEATTLHNIAKTFETAQERRQARQYLEQALPIVRNLGDARGEAFTLAALGVVSDQLGEKEKALDYYNQALTLARKVNDPLGEALILNNLGSAYHAAGQYEKALGHFERALPLWRAMGDRSGQAVTLYNSARIERDQGKLAEALARVRSAVELVEFIRTSIASKDLRASYFATVQDFYELYIDLLLRLHALNPQAGYQGEALKVSELAKARSLLELLAEAGANIRQGIDPDLLERERALQQRLNASERNRLRLMESAHTREEEEAANKELDKLIAQYRQLQAEIRRRTPRYAALAHPQPLSLSEIQSQLLDDNTLFLEYFLGSEKSYLWAVTRSSISSYELPRQAEIDELAQQLYLIFIERTEANKDLSVGKIDRQGRDERIAKADADYPAAALALSRVVLAPVAKQLNNKRLLIAADGALQFIPFSALFNPLTADNKSPLITTNEIVTIPSATTLALERKHLSGRKPAEKTVAVLADPVFDASDERVRNINIKVKEAVKEGVPEARSLERISEDEGDKGLISGKRLRVPRLPFTEDEARQIIGLVPEASAYKASGFQANRELAMGAELARYRYLHFATHGYLDAERPEFSALIFSMLNDQGEPRDGFLRTHEVFNLTLPAEMVVLSACETGLGKVVKGEGLVGLTRAFMYAGAARVLVSLWSINDRASAELMKSFYRKVLAEKMRPAAALREAQIEMIKAGKFSAPYYWAPFTIQGEFN